MKEEGVPMAPPGAGSEDGGATLGPALGRLRSRFYGAIVNDLLPHVVNLGDTSDPAAADLFYHDIPYHDHEGVSVQLDVHAPPFPGPHPVLVAFHGGAWIYGMRENLRRAARYLARQGFVVFNCSYRLARDHPFPAGVQDAVCALRWVHRHAAEYGGDPGRIGVWGDSAGGHLSAVIAAARHAPAVQPECACTTCESVPVEAAVHFYGVYDFERFARLRFPFVRGIMRTVFGERHADPAALQELSPVTWAERGKVPPTLLLCGAYDPLLGETQRYARRLRELGTDVGVRVYPHGVHGFVYLWWTGEYRHSLALAAGHFRRHLGAGVH